MPTRLLVLGGTGFVGPAVIDDALARGWQVTALNRGTRPAPEGVTVLRGDRTTPGGLSTLDDGRWTSRSTLGIVTDRAPLPPRRGLQRVGLEPAVEGRVLQGGAAS